MRWTTEVQQGPYTEPRIHTIFFIDPRCTVRIYSLNTLLCNLVLSWSDCLFFFISRFIVNRSWDWAIFRQSLFTESIDLALWYGKVSDSLISVAQTRNVTLHVCWFFHLGPPALALQLFIVAGDLADKSFSWHSQITKTACISLW